MKDKQTPSVGTIIKTILLLFIGLRMLWSGLISTAVFGAVGIPSMLVGGLLVGALVGRWVKKNRISTNSYRSVEKNTPSRSQRGQSRRTFEPPAYKAREYKAQSHRPSEECDHANLPPKQRALKQLETLYGAGLYTSEEYHQKKREIALRWG